MKRILLLFFVLQSAALIHAGNIPYEKLDSVSALVSKLQLKANGLTYNNGYSDYELSFAEENFKILFSTQLAYKSVYKKWNGREILFFTENIDLSKATEITWEVLGNSIIDVKLYFPKGLLKTQQYDNGNLINTTNDNYLEFFSNNQSRDMLFNSINDVCALFRIAKGLTTEKTIADENRDWKALSETAFVNKYPNALRAMQANSSIAQKEEKRREDARIENERLEKIRLEKERKEAEVKQAAYDQEQRLLEEQRLKKLRNVSFGAFRIGYVNSTDGKSKKLPLYYTNNPGGSFFMPYETGKFGLKYGFSGGFTGIVALEFINKKLPPRIGLGVLLDFNVAELGFSWSGLDNATMTDGFLYKDAKYNPFFIVSAGIGLSFTVRPINHVFIDFYYHPDFYCTAGGGYKLNTSQNGNNYKIETVRIDNGIGINHTLGVNIRFRRLLLGFDWHNGVIDKQKFNETYEYTWNSQIIRDAVVLDPYSGLNLSYLTFSIGIIF